MSRSPARLVFRPEVVSLDEPFASVDALTRAEPHDVLLAVHAHTEGQRVTIVHVADDVDRPCTSRIA